MLTLEFLQQLPIPVFREQLPSFLAGFIDSGSAGDGARLVAASVADWTDEQAESVRTHLLSLGEEPRVYPAHPLCRSVSRAWCRDVVTDVEIRGIDALLRARAAGPVLILSNHLSYFDTTATDAALHRHGATELADALLALAGPRVYDDAFRRFAAACLSTLPVPQSTTFEHTARMSPRDLARRTIASVRATHDAARSGAVPILYAEGSRSRSGRLGPFLRAVHRYLGCADMQVIPTAITGTSAMMPVGEATLKPGRVTLCFGEPIEAGRARSKQALEESWLQIADLLPEEHAPPVDTDPSASL